MRVKSEIVVAALVRRAFSDGGFAAIERRGAAEGGAIFVRQRFRDGSETLYGPAPQSLFHDEDAGVRRFEMRCDRAAPEEAATIIEREIRFDGDCWVVELEMDAIGDLFEVVDAD